MKDLDVPRGPSNTYKDRRGILVDKEVPRDHGVCENNSVRSGVRLIGYV